MKKRFALYGFGFAIGLVLVFFFLGGKKASCNWLPNDRMLKIIRQKQINYSAETQQMINNTEIDSLDINLILDHGDIDFSKSQVKNNPCRKYLINGTQEQKNISLT
ncbi:MAG: DUF4258 domain-containing protein, partial [Flavobacteriaceae bacterium]|nr:DUF4258 domain-containing protein [Flavobacteriaceae bacterium]